MFYRCLKCKKRYFRSVYDKNQPYSVYCNQCNVNEIINEMERPYQQQQQQKQLQRKRKLERTDNEKEYLDSSKCEYTKSEYDQLKSEQLKLRNHLHDLKIAIGKTNDKLKEIDIKLAIAQREQYIRRKLRRETRILIPALEEVKKNVNQVRTNILNTTSEPMEQSNEFDEDSDYLPSVEEVFKDVLKPSNELEEVKKNEY